MLNGQQKTWDVRVNRATGFRYIGQVTESTEPLARCAALSRFGLTEDDIAQGTEPNGSTIFPTEEFDVSPACMWVAIIESHLAHAI